jgi:hypothetical protein
MTNARRPVYSDGLLVDSVSGQPLAVLFEARGWELWESLDCKKELLVVDHEGEWLDDARVRFFADGRALYHDRVEGFDILSVIEVNELWDLGAFVRAHDLLG